MNCTFHNGEFVCDEPRESDVHGPDGTHVYEVGDAWRERDEILGDFDDMTGDEHSMARRLELEVAIGTRDSIADVAEELRDLNKAIRDLVSKGASRS